MARSLAILIDGENIPARLLPPLQQKVATLGTPTLWQVFGDFISWPHPEWQEAARTNGIEIRHVFHHGGKNAADVALAISAMDILHDRRIGGFCIVSSDTDFAALAQRLRGGAVAVYGFGEDKAPAALRRAYTEFFVLEPPAPVAEPEPFDVARLETQRLHELLHSACRENGANGRISASFAGIYLKDTAPDLWAAVGGGKGHFLKKLKDLGLIDMHVNGGRTEISVKFRPLAAVR